jgi:hypothetical protein
MLYPYLIRSLEQYHTDHQKSIFDPEGFWPSVAENFYCVNTCRLNRRGLNVKFQA